MDMKNLLENYNWVYSVLYKTGVIGDGSVGKSAFVMKLAEVEEFSSMIAIKRSTFGYLEFDTLIYKDPRNGKFIPITFIDVEGATDTDKSQEFGDYIELINKADCDLYIIVFDRLFSEHNRFCQDYVEKGLQRKCLLVRSKSDLMFSEYFRQLTGKKYVKRHIVSTIM
jgi:GTPase SAR1 family protein